MEKRKTLNEILQDFADSIKKETLEDLKVTLEMYLKAKYSIVLTDDDWNLLINH